MSGICLLCALPAEQRERFDAALRAGASVRDVARESGVSKSAVSRHRANHLDAGQPADREQDGSRAREEGASAVATPATVADPLPVEVLKMNTCEPTRWRVVAPMIRYQRADGTPATAPRGETVTDLHPAYQRALSAARVITPA